MAFDSPESPRFLIMKYRLKEAHSLLNSVSRTNNGTLHLENWEISDNGAKVADSVRENVKSLVVHFSATTMRLWLLWFSSSLVYYGIILASPRFFSTKNKYRDILISSVAEFPGFLVPLFFIDRFGRKRTLGVLYMITSVFCGLLSWGFSEAVSVICTFIVRGSVSAAFISLYVTTAESYPTSLRSSGFGLASCFARIAGVFTSFVSEDGSITLATGVFSMFGFFAAIAALTLPRETANQNLPSDGCDPLPYQRTLESDYEDLTVHSRESSLSIEEKLSPLIF
uniref:Major facilitator superfamily (MFS) profile domain-containing protein n=1 Tax=Spongospora subterranea TaxID=70186 RepID=A0A0H5R7C1_9EUKA|eukprot:CRZ09711.1 hypothetical protein [Spongospora subterranea]